MQLQARLLEIRDYETNEKLLSDSITRGQRMVDAEIGRTDRLDRKAQLTLLGAAGTAPLFGLLSTAQSTPLLYLLLVALGSCLGCTIGALWPRGVDSLCDADWLAIEAWPFPDVAQEQYLIGPHRHLHERREMNSLKAWWILRAQVAVATAIAVVVLRLLFIGPRTAALV